MDAPTSPTDVLTELRSSTHESLDRVVALTYAELRAIAHRRLAALGPGATLSTTALVHERWDTERVLTALVHEAYLKLVDQSQARWQDLAHFHAVASLAMRHILVDRARERCAVKRGGPMRRQVTLDDEAVSAEDQPEALLQLNEALERLAIREPRLARVVDCRFFGGLTEQETANALSLTTRTVQRDWLKARIMLRHLLES